MADGAWLMADAGCGARILLVILIVIVSEVFDQDYDYE